MEKQPDLFDDVRGMVRNADCETSIDAAHAIERKLSALQTRVLGLVAAHGPVSDEFLSDFAMQHGMAESTMRKRRTELRDGGLIECAGLEVNRRGRTQMTWRVTERGRARACAHDRL